ncbi:pimeloyl-ACP methyl ester carboxylesterase [Maribacter vaceletii]|uniref:Pimeloyl-ACP methyl ester carboxylesterase n=1 Tax=Maribacter vaceletii TaxID=1206816 RepID=A0A495E6C9_9FLAO|nr:alpha/beta hydrolase [Maribacter vaceletii]RKR12470.1 pimeloyl-ACP methyl ester carboxylesterase [Maribacter vaceletii]
MKKLLYKIIPLAYGKYFDLMALFSPKKTAEKVFYFFCTIRKGRVGEHQKEYLENAKKEQLSIAKHSIQTYQWAGEKETVLLVHGWESNTFRWRNLIEKLKEEKFNIIAFDAPGHGHSSGKHLYVPLYAEVLQQMVEKHRPKHIVGHSLGGMTILYNTYKNHNEDLEKIVTIGSPSEFYKLVNNFQNILKFNTRVLKAFENYIKERFDFYIKDFSTAAYVQTNTNKGLLFHDKLDKIAPYEDSENVHKNWKNSTFITTEGLGHSMHQEQVNNQILGFLKA